MAHRFSALLRFWDVLQLPRYAFWLDRLYSLDELIRDIYCMTLEAWCPGGPASVREHLVLVVERMARAAREDCVEAVLRMMSALVPEDAGLKHKEFLGDPAFLRERLATLPPQEFERFSSADRYAVSRALFDWDRALGQRTIQ